MWWLFGWVEVGVGGDLWSVSVIENCLESSLKEWIHNEEGKWPFLSLNKSNAYSIAYTSGNWMQCQKMGGLHLQDWPVLSPWTDCFCWWELVWPSHFLQGKRLSSFGAKGAFTAVVLPQVPKSWIGTLFFQLCPWMAFYTSKLSRNLSNMIPLVSLLMGCWTKWAYSQDPTL